MLTLVAPMNGSKICGIYRFRANASDHSDIGSFSLCRRRGHLEIWSFGIYGDHRGKGYGQQMLREAIEVADGNKLVLYVEKDNDRAIHVYEKCGFRITGKFMGEKAWVMTYVGNQASTAEKREVCCA